ncbi:MAG: hypothetical protein KatS3mg096_188 [Candidatus Parcubacteria bacterium]|nr:MAG: hypothetical protein KatS3mg096_188 [Candidatus Parcubacteria bacterium]
MKSLISIRKKIVEKKKKYFEHYLEYAQKIKEAAIQVLGEAKVLVFGSVVKGNWGPNSDIDVLIISSKWSGDYENDSIIKFKIKKLAGVSHPFPNPYSNS